MKEPIITKLKNGLRISTDEMHEVETVSIGIFVHTGSRNEIESINGISHFLEHMAFKGTDTRSARKIAEDFEGIGGYINAYTSREKTVYYVKVLKEYAEYAVEFLSDIIQNSLFESKEIKKESTVILQELAMSIDTPDDIIFDYFQETAYPNQSIGRPIIGSKKNIKKFNRQDFINYINNYYSYENIVIAGAGNISHKNLTKWTEKYFNKLSQNKKIKLEKASYKGGSFLETKKLEQVHYLLGFHGVSYHDKNYYKSQILSLILGGGMSSRLFQKIREDQGLAYSIYSFNHSFNDSGIFGIYGGTSVEKINKMIDSISNELLKITKKISDEELKRAKTQFIASLKMSKESSSSRMQKLGSNILFFNKNYSDDEVIAKFKDIDIGEISDYAKNIFSTNSTVSVIGNVKEVKKFSI
jgi:predicted Zn-dependent peptidase